jgi:hypothetical protein
MNACAWCSYRLDELICGLLCCICEICSIYVPHFVINSDKGTRRRSSEQFTIYWSGYGIHRASPEQQPIT